MSVEGEIVEEEYLVYAELCDNTDSNIFSHAETSFKSFALDSDQPILTIGGQAFVGKYKDTVGTAVFLEEVPTTTGEEIGFGKEPSDPLFVNTPSNKLQYVCHTRKSLEMSRVLLLEKKKDVQQLGNVEESKECVFPGELHIGDEGKQDEISDNFNDLTGLVGEAEGLGVDRVKMELQGEVLPSTIDDGQMIKNIEKMKIITHSD